MTSPHLQKQLSNASIRGARILILLPGNKLFGQERALLNLGLTLRDLGAEVTYLLHEKWGAPIISGEVEALGFSWHTLPLGTIWSLKHLARYPFILADNIWCVWKTGRKLRDICLSGTYSVIIMGNLTFSFYLLPALRQLPLLRIFRHGDAPSTSNFLQRWISKKVLKSIDHHVANCKYIERELTRFDPKALPRVIYNCPVQFYIDSDLNNISTPKLAQKRNLLLFVGQLTKHKGADLCLKAFNKLAEEYPFLELHMVGSAPGVGAHGSELNLTVQMQEKWGDRVQHTHFISDLTEAYMGSSLHLCPSTWDDPSPNVILEAKFYGVPSVVFNRGGISELVDHRIDGYVCSTSTVEGLMDGIRYFLDSPEALLLASSAARANMETRFSYTKYKQSWVSALGTWLARNDQRD